MTTEAESLSAYMLLGINHITDVTGKIGVTKEDNVVIRSDHDKSAAEAGKVEKTGTNVEMLSEVSGIFDGVYSQWYQIRTGEISGFVQQHYINLVKETKGKLEAQLGEVKWVVEGNIPEGAILTVKPYEISEGDFSGYYNANVREYIHSIWPYEIKVSVNGVDWQPKEEDPLKVTVTGSGINVGGDEILGVAQFAPDMDTPPENIAEVGETSFTYNAYRLSPHVYFTADGEFVGGEQVEGTNWMDISLGQLEVVEEAAEEEADTESVVTD